MDSVSLVDKKKPLITTPDALYHVGTVAVGSTYFIAGPVSKDATGTFSLGNLQVITNSYCQTVLSPENKPVGKNKNKAIQKNLMALD